MRPDDRVEQCLSVVDHCLRTMFPRDFDKRCLYAAFGLHTLLRGSGMDAHIIGGDFVAFVVARDNKRASVQGFASNSGPESHYWVETDSAIIDLGTHYLPRASSFPAAKMPIACWPLTEQLPAYLRYRARKRYPSNVQLASDNEILQRMEEFLQRCVSRSAAQGNRSKLPSWLLTGSSSLTLAADRGDLWARGAIRFARGTRLEQLSF